MRRIIWINGLIGGAVIISLFFIFNALSPVENCDYSKSMVMTYAAMVVGFTSIFFGIKTYRDKDLGGSISFGKAFLIGLYISLIASAVYAIGWQAFSHLLMPGHMEAYGSCDIENFKQEGHTALEIAKKEADTKQMLETLKNPILGPLMIFSVEIFPVGLAISLLCAAILKRQPQKPAKA
jgi:hypothetical protein